MRSCAVLPRAGIARSGAAARRRARRLAAGLRRGRHTPERSLVPNRKVRVRRGRGGQFRSFGRFGRRGHRRNRLWRYAGIGKTRVDGRGKRLRTFPVRSVRLRGGGRCRTNDRHRRGARRGCRPEHAVAHPLTHEDRNDEYGRACGKDDGDEAFRRIHLGGLSFCIPPPPTPPTRASSRARRRALRHAPCGRKAFRRD